VNTRDIYWYDVNGFLNNIVFQKLIYVRWFLSFSEGFYRNVNFRYGVFKGITSRSGKNPSSRKREDPTDQTKTDDSSDDGDELSSLFDHDLSTYATLKTDELSLEQMDGQDFEDRNSESLDNDELDTLDQIADVAPKFKVLQRVYVSDRDGVMYVATIRRRLYGPQYQKQVDMGFISSMDEALALLQGDETESMWHYFVHYEHWNVNFDRWVPEFDVHAISDEVSAVAQRISKEHRSLQQEMRKVGVKGKKTAQTVDGAKFLREWKKRLDRIRLEMNFGVDRNIAADKSDDDLQIISKESDVVEKARKKSMTWTKAALSKERKFRNQGLTSQRASNQGNCIVLPFALKKILVQQWEYINQCQMMPCIPAAVNIRQALNKYLESKNVELSTSTSPTNANDHEKSHRSDPQHHENVAAEDTSVAESVLSQTNGPIDSEVCTDLGIVDSSASKTTIDSGSEDQGQEWREMADGIAMLFDEALESRILYREELPQLRTIDSFPEYAETPYSELYGCEHLLRLFVRLPEMLSDNLPDEEARPIIAKVNDFVRFLHKNQGTILTQTHRKLNVLELTEQKKLHEVEVKEQLKLSRPKRKNQLDELDTHKTSNKKSCQDKEFSKQHD
jgi:MRG/RNA binding activity-knot of a chromodomain